MRTGILLQCSGERYTNVCPTRRRREQGASVAAQPVTAHGGPREFTAMRAADQNGGSRRSQRRGRARSGRGDVHYHLDRP